MNRNRLNNMNNKTQAVEGKPINIGLRDYFAGQAMLAALTSPANEFNPSEEDRIAIWSYGMADAMLGRKKETKQ
jgi:hypothetical protein